MSPAPGSLVTRFNQINCESARFPYSDLPRGFGSRGKQEAVADQNAAVQENRAVTHRDAVAGKNLIAHQYAAREHLDIASQDAIAHGDAVASQNAQTINTLILRD